jgi:YHS domain-containing protein
MARVTDPVCGMVIDSDSAAARSKDAAGRTVYFCSVDCQREFEAHPERYDERAVADGAVRGDAPDVERGKPWGSEQPGTTPKFGAAGSGGAEYEPIDDRDLR